jgi:hypothetical protein
MARIVGLFLYEKAGAIDRVAAAVKAGEMRESLKEDGISLTVCSEPQWAAKATAEEWPRSIPFR